jgi:histidinol-phosphate aminotransferase
MSRYLDLVTKAAREMPGYAATAPREPGRRAMIRLDSNENPFGPSPFAIKAMRAALKKTHFYPDDNCSELCAKIADRHGLSTEQVMLGPGCTALVSVLCRTLLAPGLNAVTSERSFIGYSLSTRASGAQLIEAPMRDNGFDPDALLAAINENTRLVFIANPNNPTGSVLQSQAIDAFLVRVPPHVVVVLDEAYYEYAAHFATLRGFEYSRSMEYVKRGTAAVVLRTFSKAHGLAGLRIGYAVGPPELLNYSARLRDTYSVSSVAQTAAVAAINDDDHILRTVKNNAGQADILTRQLSDLGLKVAPTSANFLYCELAEQCAGFVASLRRKGISVRPLAAWGASNAVRITIGTPEQNRALLDAALQISKDP